MILMVKKTNTSFGLLLFQLHGMSSVVDHWVYSLCSHGIRIKERENQEIFLGIFLCYTGCVCSVQEHRHYVTGQSKSGFVLFSFLFSVRR